MSQDAQPTILLAPGLGGLRAALEPIGAVVDFPQTDLSGFCAGEGRSVRAFVTVGSRPVDAAISSLPGLALVAVIGSGFEAIDVEALRKQGTEVTNSPNANHEDVADHAVGLMIALVRKIVAGDRRVREGGWIKDRHARPTRSIKSLKVGITGLGAIGLAIAERLEPFGCEISWWGPRPKPLVKFARRDSVLALAEECDVLIVAHRADDSNKGLINRGVIDAVGPRGVIVNIARGSAVDEDALIDALKSGALGGAALDVFETEPTPAERWLDVPNVVLTPHTAGGGDAALANMTSMVTENVRRLFADEPLLTPVPA